ncbi:MAG: hypothetical protein KAI66_24900, partial [Lentisphaeria bacterium]|nr:hypothetical protein [Lentisphaeria bacterium]
HGSPYTPTITPTSSTLPPPGLRSPPSSPTSGATLPTARSSASSPSTTVTGRQKRSLIVPTTFYQAWKYLTPSGQVWSWIQSGPEALVRQSISLLAPDQTPDLPADRHTSTSASTPRTARLQYGADQVGEHDYVGRDDNGTLPTKALHRPPDLADIPLNTTTFWMNLWPGGRACNATHEESCAPIETCQKSGHCEIDLLHGMTAAILAGMIFVIL